MKVVDLKKILSVINDDVDIAISVYREGKLDSESSLSSVEIEGEYDEVTRLVLKSYFNGIKRDKIEKAKR